MKRLSTHLALFWLRGACWITIGTGIVALLAAHPLGEEPWRFLFDVLKWPVDGDPAGFSSDSRAINAVLGGVMVGWGVLMLDLMRVERFDERIRRSILKSIVIWFLLDSTASFAAGLPGNVLLNLGFLALFLFPLLAVEHS